MYSYLFYAFLTFVFVVVLNKSLKVYRKFVEKKVKLNKMNSCMFTRGDICEYGIDYYLNLCKYIIIEKGLSKDVVIQNITGRDIVDIKFYDLKNIQVYSSCILKDKLNDEEFEGVNYDEVIDLLNFMIEDNVSKGIIFTNTHLDNDALEFINDLNKNSLKYRIEIIDGYEIIEFARRRNELVLEEVRYA